MLRSDSTSWSAGSDAGLLVGWVEGMISNDSGVLV